MKSDLERMTPSGFAQILFENCPLGPTKSFKII